MLRAIGILFFATTVGSMTVGCTPSRQYSTSIRSGATAMLAAVGRAAAERGLEVTESGRGITVTVADSYVELVPYGRDVVMLVTAEDARQSSVKQVADELLTRAQGLASR